MRTTTRKAVTVFYILDRLLDDKPRVAAKNLHATTFDVRAYKSASERVLEESLNTRHYFIYVFLLLLVMTQAGCGFLPVANYLPEPQAKVEMKIFRGYGKVQNQPWQITLTYEPQVLLDGESAELQKGNMIFNWTSNELRANPVHILIPDSAVLKTGEQTFSFAIPRETLDDRPGNYVLSEMEILKGEAKIARAKVILPEPAPITPPKMRRQLVSMIRGNPPYTQHHRFYEPAIEVEFCSLKVTIPRRIHPQAKTAKRLR